MSKNSKSILIYHHQNLLNLAFFEDYVSSVQNTTHPLWKSKDSFMCSQEFATGLCPKSFVFNSCLPIPFV
jgi:hypothetical protein